MNIMETVLVNHEGHVATITVNRPKTLSALNTQVLAELNQALDEVAANNDIYALVLTRAGEKSFIADADIAEMRNKGVEEATAYGEFSNEVFHKIETSRCPMIAAVNNFTLDGGREPAMSCDIRVVSGNAVSGQSEVGLGITPGSGETQRLVRLVGTGIVEEMTYIARNIEVERAYAIGPVNNIVPVEELMAVVMKMANGVVKNTPIAAAYSKKIINNGLQTDIDGGIAIEVKEFSNCLATEDQTCGMACSPEGTKDKKFSNK